eukprot:TRINITY_DN314_c0_g1_i2.p3 TRINITY_DN314_c0_g1~~TRINITY_DN314_c0_g1_i2.p3  ORF type:complete len:115 (+),score=32.56 TRINITY_DN314_c0_g1_i2:199-543(+)
MASFAAIVRSLMAVAMLLAALVAQPASGANKILVTPTKHVETETLALSEVQQESQQQRQRAEALAKHRAEATGASLAGGLIFATLAVGMLCFGGSKPTPASAQRLLASGGVVKV